MSDEGGASGLVQFLLLAKTAKGHACKALIQTVLSNKKTFVFGELLAMPNVQGLRGTEHEPTLRQLEIFAYGTFLDYKSQAPELPELSAVQVEKLRMLSIVSLAHKHKVVPYKTLKEELEVDEVRRLEDLIFDTIYSGLIQGKLDQRQGLLKVKYAIARDVRMEDLDAMIIKLGKWATATERLMMTMQNGAAKAAAARHEEMQNIESTLAAAGEAKMNLKELLAKQREEEGYHDMNYDMGGERQGMRRGRTKRNRVPGMSDFRPRNK
ncbi:unnamed protein product [Discosporangium mesarthrocarpum]